MQLTTAPFRALTCEIKPEWMSVGLAHLSVSNYVMLFNQAAMNFLASMGVDDDYMAIHNQAYVVGGLHVLYESEIFSNETAIIEATVADAGEKRIHLALEMFRAGESHRIAFAEMLLVSFNLAAGRSCPWAGDTGAKLAAMKAGHDALPRPKGFGQSVGIRPRQASSGPQLGSDA